jgi:hypothetical protein
MPVPTYDVVDLAANGFHASRGIGLGRPAPSGFARETQSPALAPFHEEAILTASSSGTCLRATVDSVNPFLTIGRYHVTNGVPLL